MAKIGSSGKPPVSPPSSQPMKPKSAAPQIGSTQPEIKEILDTPPPSPRKGEKTTRTAASEAHAASIRGEKDEGQVSKQKSMLESVEKKDTRIPTEESKLSSVGKDISREVGNLGVAGKYAAEKVGKELKSAAEKSSIFGKGLLDRLSGKDPALDDIKKIYGKEVRDDFLIAQKSAQAELDAIVKKQTESKSGWLTPDDKEKLTRLEGLNEAFQKQPLVIAQHLSENRNDDAYKFMGPAKFASLEVTTRDLVEKSEATRGKSYGLSAMERVSLYGYTTQDFATLNPALRSGTISDPKLQSYVNHINTGLTKLDDFNPKPGEHVYRGVRYAGLPPHIQAEYKPGGRLQDLAFTSTSTDSTVAFAGYDLKCTITGTDGKGGKILPFSAHAGEREILFPPGTGFEVQARTPMNPKGIPKGWDVNDIADFESKQNSWILRMV